MQAILWFFIAFIALPIADKCAAGQQPLSPFVIGAPREAFPLLAVDTLVRDRLAIEWQQDNRFQHERGYCVLYLTMRRFDSDGNPLVIYWITDIKRGDESDESATGGTIGCHGYPNETLLHIHPPAVCPEHDEGSHCMLRHPFGQQCYPSPTDLRELNRGSQPFWIIQCDKYALVPVWRTEPYPPAKPAEGSHR